MNNFSIATKFLLICAGVDMATMAQCTPAEVNRYRLMGTCVLIPTLLGFFSGGYTMLLVSGSLLLTAIFAPAWSFIIFTLDRAVVATTRPGVISGGIIGRVLLAVIISFTISEPLTLKIFGDAIEDQRVVIVTEKEQTATAKIEHREDVIRKESKAEEAAVDALNKSYIGEVDGTSGSKKPYRGPIAEVKWQAYQKALGDYNKHEALRYAELTKLTSAKQKALQQVDDSDAKGFLGNLRILGRLMDEDKHVWWCVWLVRILFLAIELIPVLIKVSSSGGFDLYHKLEFKNDETQFCVQEQMVTAKAEVMTLQQKALLDAERYKLHFEGIKTVINSSSKLYEYLINRCKDAAEEKLKVQVQLLDKINDMSLKQQLQNQIDQAYDGYVKTLEAIMAESKAYHTTHDIN